MNNFLEIHGYNEQSLDFLDENLIKYHIYMLWFWLIRMKLIIDLPVTFNLIFLIGKSKWKIVKTLEIGNFVW
jgi:hypothetical protein